MAGIEGRKALNDGMQSWLFGLERNVKEGAEEAGIAAASRGKSMMEHVIDTTESDLSNTPKDNRNWTFDMRNSLAWQTTRKGTTTTLEVGWLSNREGYFLIQEYGGVVDGKTVSPMNALMAGYHEMLNTLEGMGLKVR